MRLAAVTRRSALALAAGALLGLAACQNGGGDAAAQGEMSLGKANAPVTVIEYASTTCPHCASWNREVWPEFKKKYVDTGQVRYVFREMLTPPYEVASAGFLLARCAGKDKYFEVVDALFRGQQEMAQSGDARGVLLRTAQSAGLTEEQFQQCITDEDQIVALQSRVERYAREEDIQGTPTFVVNGRKTEGVEMADLDRAIQPLLKKPSGG